MLRLTTAVADSETTTIPDNSADDTTGVLQQQKARLTTVVADSETTTMYPITLQTIQLLSHNNKYPTDNRSRGW